jgi:hypothetical protein
MKTISIPVNNRPDHLRDVLASIRACPTWREWTIVFSCEPPILTAIEQQTTVTPNAVVSRNEKPLGCWANTFHASTLAMALAPAVNLYLEDDYLITPDTLTLVDQWEKEIYGGVLCLRRPHAKQDSAQTNVVAPLDTGLFGCGFAWLAQDWPLVRRQWMGIAPMWDIAMHNLPLTQWRPMVNRSKGIGLIGTHSHGSGADLNLFGPAYSGPPVNKFTFQS